MDNLDLEKLISAYKLAFSSHAKREMLYEEHGVIHEHEIKECIRNGEIIENYKDDKPYASILIFGKTKTNRPLHVVCALVHQEKRLIIITTYQPDEKKWIDYKGRIK